jgi:hypothetical protein
MYLNLLVVGVFENNVTGMKLLYLITRTYQYLMCVCIYIYIYIYIYYTHFIEAYTVIYIWYILPYPFSGAFAKLRKATVTFVVSARSSAWNNLALTGRIFMKFDI